MATTTLDPPTKCRIPKGKAPTRRVKSSPTARESISSRNPKERATTKRATAAMVERNATATTKPKDTPTTKSHDRRHRRT